MASFKNGVGNGFHIHNENLYTGIPKTIIVVGYKRSGTTAVAEILKALGIDFTPESDPNLNENKHLCRLLKGWKNHPLEAYVKSNNAKFPQWGFKRPECNQAVIKKVNVFTTPVFIFVSRDPLAVANRVSWIEGTPLEEEYNRVVKQSHFLFKRVLRAKVPSFHISYEKLMTNPLPIIEALQVFIKREVEQNVIERACQVVMPNENNYTRLWRPKNSSKGYLDDVTPKIVSGWAYDPTKNEPIMVELIIDGDTV